MNKTCGACKQSLELSMFTKNASSRDGLYSICKVCRKARHKIYYDRTIEERRPKLHTNWVKHKYGMSGEDYAALRDAQCNLCAICHNPQRGRKRLAVDHNHDTGTVRGLLCDDCNRALGLMKENIITMNNAIRYLEAHK